MNIEEKKANLRKEIDRERGKLTKDRYMKDASFKIRELLENLEEYKNASSLFCYISMEEEPATHDLIKKALDDGKVVGVPRCLEDGIMIIKKIEAFDNLEKNIYGILEPKIDAADMTDYDFDLAIVPCMTCNLKGKRLGHGKGYYDRFLAKQKKMVKTCVLCFDKLLREDIPVDSLDIDMDMVATEKGIIHI